MPTSIRQLCLSLLRINILYVIIKLTLIRLRHQSIRPTVTHSAHTYTEVRIEFQLGVHISPYRADCDYLYFIDYGPFANIDFPVLSTTLSLRLHNRVCVSTD